MEDPESLLREIEANARLPVDFDDSSSSSTLTGIGMVSGRVIKTVGSLTLQGVGIANMHTRLVWMIVQLRTDRRHLPERFYEDIMELQRIRLYSKWVRKQAWELIFLLLEQRRADLIAGVLSRWKSVDVKLFLSQLEVCRGSDWTVDVSRVGSAKDTQTKRSSVTATDIDHKTRLTDGFCDLALAIFMDDDSTFHATLGDTLAWKYILLLVEKRRFAGIVAVLEKWSPEGCRLFLHDLASSMLMHWVTSPDKHQPCLDDVLQTFPCHPDKGSQSSERADVLSECCRGLFLEMATTHPLMLSEVFTVRQFAALQSHGASQLTAASHSGLFISHFLGTVRHHLQIEGSFFENWTLPLRAITFIKYLSGVDVTLIGPVIEELTSLIISVVEELTPTLQVQGGDGLQPLLCFTLHLCGNNSIACRLLYDLGILDVIAAVLSKLSDAHPTSQAWLLTGCGLVSLALQAHLLKSYGDNVDLPRPLVAWCSSLSYTETIDKALNDMSEHCKDHYMQDQWLTLFQLRSHYDSHRERNPWSSLLSVPTFAAQEPPNASLSWSVSQVILSFIATQSSDQWAPLMEAFTAKSVNDLYRILVYILRVFIRKPGASPVVPEPTKVAFAQMYQHAHANHRTTVNPMDLFVEFLNLVCQQSPAFQFALYRAGGYELVSEVHSGFYDFISGPVNPETKSKRKRSQPLERRKRQAVCVEVQQGLVAYSAVPAADLGRTPILSPGAQAVSRDPVHVTTPLQFPGQL